MAVVFQAASPGEADIRAALVDSRGLADLLVCRVGSRGLAHGDALWHITRDRQSASVRIWFGSIGMSQVKICFVPTRGEAGWCRPHRLRGRLG